LPQTRRDMTTGRTNVGASKPWLWSR
jgi:hypothetical protein